VRFHHTLHCMKKQRLQLGWATSWRHKKLRNHWYSTATTTDLALPFKHANSIVFATFVQQAWCTSR